jgi:hypothetical protein
MHMIQLVDSTCCVFHQRPRTRKGLIKGPESVQRPAALFAGLENFSPADFAQNASIWQNEGT